MFLDFTCTIFFAILSQCPCIFKNVSTLSSIAKGYHNAATLVDSYLHKYPYYSNTTISPCFCYLTYVHNVIIATQCPHVSVMVAAPSSISLDSGDSGISFKPPKRATVHIGGASGKEGNKPPPPPPRKPSFSGEWWQNEYKDTCCVIGYSIKTHIGKCFSC